MNVQWNTFAVSLLKILIISLEVTVVQEDVIK